MGIKVGKSAPGKPALWFHAGIHAREWVAVASCVYIIDQLLTSSDPSVKALRENLVWYIIPVTNPDGYEYLSLTTVCGVKPFSRTPTSARVPTPTAIGTPPSEPPESPETPARTSTQDPIPGPNPRPDLCLKRSCR